MNAVVALLAVGILSALAYFGGGSPPLQALFATYIPLAAAAVFLAGLVWRVLRWARTPVPFRITTTCGQQKSLGWVKHAWIENPANALGVVVRMALEILFFRSLFRNTAAEVKEGPRLIYGESKWLWLGALAFHWTFLVILLRHMRFFLEPVPICVNILSELDGFFQVGAPVLYISDGIILAALGYLLLRRFANPQVRYISLFTDYFALFLLLGVAGSGVLMRYFTRVDVVAVKEFALGLVTLSPTVPKGLEPLFFVHLFLLSVLAAYFPFSKLMHAPGVFLSPTRALANNNRRKRHLNPWNAPVKVHTYQEWEEEFHDKIVAAGLPLDRE